MLHKLKPKTWDQIDAVFFFTFENFQLTPKKQAKNLVNPEKRLVEQLFRRFAPKSFKKDIKFSPLRGVLAIFKPKKGLKKTLLPAPRGNAQERLLLEMVVDKQ